MGEIITLQASRLHETQGRYVYVLGGSLVGEFSMDFGNGDASTRRDPEEPSCAPDSSRRGVGKIRHVRRRKALIRDCGATPASTTFAPSCPHSETTVLPYTLLK